MENTLAKGAVDIATALISKPSAPAEGKTAYIIPGLGVVDKPSRELMETVGTAVKNVLAQKAQLPSGAEAAAQATAAPATQTQGAHATTPAPVAPPAAPAPDSVQDVIDRLARDPAYKAEFMRRLSGEAPAAPAPASVQEAQPVAAPPPATPPAPPRAVAVPAAPWVPAPVAVEGVRAPEEPPPVIVDAVLVEPVAEVAPEVQARPATTAEAPVGSANDVTAEATVYANESVAAAADDLVKSMMANQAFADALMEEYQRVKNGEAAPLEPPTPGSGLTVGHLAVAIHADPRLRQEFFTRLAQAEDEVRNPKPKAPDGPAEAAVPDDPTLSPENIQNAAKTLPGVLAAQLAPAFGKEMAEDFVAGLGELPPEALESLRGAMPAQGVKDIMSGKLQIPKINLPRPTNGAPPHGAPNESPEP
jgi:hypothetical protein